METIEPVGTREPFFDGWDTDKARYTFACRSCGTGVTIYFKEMLEAAWGWREKTDTSLRSSIARHFGIDLTDKYIGDGMDAVVASRCSKCAGTTYVYFWFHEYRHSCYQISVRGVASEEV